MEPSVPISEFVLSTVATVCNIDRAELTLATNVHEISLDSLSRASIVSLVEARYALEVTPDELLRFLRADLLEDFVGCVEAVLSRSTLS